jgi:hypothetical protein
VPDLNEVESTEGIPGGPSLEELCAFADETLKRSSSNYYTNRWVRSARGSGRMGFNCAALILGPNWCLWRKQYLLAVGVVAAEFAFSFVLGFGYVLGRGNVAASDPVLGLLSYLAFLLVRIVLAAYANGLYLKRAKSVILEAQSLPSHEERINTIRAKGRTSALAFSIGVVASAFLYFWLNTPSA